MHNTRPTQFREQFITAFVSPSPNLSWWQGPATGNKDDLTTLAGTKFTLTLVNLGLN